VVSTILDVIASLPGRGVTSDGTRDLRVPTGQVLNGGLQSSHFFYEIDSLPMPLDRPRFVSFEGKWVEESLSTRHPTDPLAKTVA